MNRYRKKAKQTFLFQSQLRSGWHFWHLRCAARISVKCDGRWICFFFPKETINNKSIGSKAPNKENTHPVILVRTMLAMPWLWTLSRIKKHLDLDQPWGDICFSSENFPHPKKNNEVGGGYLGLECAAALVGWGVWSLEKRQGASGPGSWFQCAVCICLCQPFDSCKVRFCWWAQEPSGYFRMLLPDTRISYSSHTSNMDQSGLISGQRDELWRVNSDASKHVWSHGHL